MKGTSEKKGCVRKEDTQGIRGRDGVRRLSQKGVRVKTDRGDQKTDTELTAAAGGKAQGAIADGEKTAS